MQFNKGYKYVAINRILIGLDEIANETHVTETLPLIEKETLEEHLSIAQKNL